MFAWCKSDPQNVASLGYRADLKFFFRIELIIVSSAVVVCTTEVPLHVTSALFTHVG